MVDTGMSGRSVYGFEINRDQALASFKQSVIDLFALRMDNRTLNYQEYLALPESQRSDDEADAVDKRFTSYVLKWLGFDNEDDWNYNRPQAGAKANRPDFSVNALIGRAFIWEDKNSTLDLNESHLKQMRRYAVDTAGYAVWSNMRRILALRFLATDQLDYEIIADISVEQLFTRREALEALDEQQQTAITNLTLFRLLFGKERFTYFKELADKIAVDEQHFKENATPLSSKEAKESFISGSRQSLDHLGLAALTIIKKSIASQDSLYEKEKALHQEWLEALAQFEGKLVFAYLSKPILALIQTKLTPRLGEIDSNEILQVKTACEKIAGTQKLTASLATAFERWLEQALLINNAFLILRFELATSFTIATAYKIWRERQSNQNDARPDIFAEQVAYVFFIRLLLVRVLEDKNIIQPRLASNGGFAAWRDYVESHFKELCGVGILHQNYCNILTHKAGNYYLHFFQQAIFDWFVPDDFLLVETLEFLCRYDFQQVASDIIGFTYEEYIQKNARKRKGHFLTRDEVVEYMLDLLGYDGLQILGRRVFDPACGSGSFLVHASSRYRLALIKSLCSQHHLPDEQALMNDAIYRKELAQRYLDALSSLFFGMELNPFACYLAEMNMLIQGLDDLFVLQQAGDIHPIERFQIFNTDSLEMPRELLDNPDATGIEEALWTPHLSNTLVDESYRMKAKLDDYAQGFFYIVSNPPYINASQVRLEQDYSAFPFYARVLSNAVNTYLLFLRLGMYYLGDGGRMIYIVPLTIIGDASAAAMRKCLTQAPFKPVAVARFFTGNVLFPGVDQAVAILRVDNEVSFEPRAGFQDWPVLLSGGYTVAEARHNSIEQQAAQVFEGAPPTPEWQAAWLVSNDAQSYSIWNHARNVAKSTLEQLWEIHLEVKKGDVASDHLHPFRLGRNHQPVQGDIAVQKGEDLLRYAPLSTTPSDWARPITDGLSDSKGKAVNATLLRIQELTSPEQGITLRKIARLNTRERLTATWFQRDKNHPFIFPDEQWRFRLLPTGDVTVARGLLALLNSRPIAYLLNLFSTNNNVAQGELARLLIPDAKTFPAAQLAALTDDLLQERAFIERQYVHKYGANLPDVDTGSVYIPPSGVLTATTRVQKLSLEGWVMQGAARNLGIPNSKIKSLRARHMIEYTGQDEACAKALDLFLDEPAREDDTWLQAQSWLLPDTAVAASWLRLYGDIHQQAQASWHRFAVLQERVDEIVADWYGFDAVMREVIAQGLPWARRRSKVDVDAHPFG